MKTLHWIIIAIVAIAIVGLVIWFYTGSNENNQSNVLPSERGETEEGVCTIKSIESSVGDSYKAQIEFDAGDGSKVTTGEVRIDSAECIKTHGIEEGAKFSCRKTGKTFSFPDVGVGCVSGLDY